MDLGLTDAVVLVVGGSGYIGVEVARQFQAEGAHVIIAARDEQRLAQAAGHLGGDVATRVMDTASAESVSGGIDAIVAEHGRLDVVVLSAAPAAQTLDPTETTDPDYVLHAVDVKTIGYLRVANAALPVMTKAGSGRIVFINGQSAMVTGNLASSVRNRAVMAASKNLADAAAGTGVTVNVVNPGMVTDTPRPASQRGAMAEVAPGQVASVIVFLASAAASGVSGEVIAVGHRALGILDG